MPNGEKLEKNTFALGGERGNGANVPTIHLTLRSVFMNIQSWVDEDVALHVSSAAIAIFPPTVLSIAREPKILPCLLA